MSTLADLYCLHAPPPLEPELDTATALRVRTEQVREVLADAIEDYRDEAPRSGETDDALGEIARRIRALRVREIEETIGVRAASIPATGGGEP